MERSKELGLDSGPVTRRPEHLYPVSPDLGYTAIKIFRPAYSASKDGRNSLSTGAASNSAAGRSDCGVAGHSQQIIVLEILKQSVEKH